MCGTSLSPPPPPPPPPCALSRVRRRGSGALVVLGRGMGTRALLAQLLRAHCATAALVLVLDATKEELEVAVGGEEPPSALPPEKSDSSGVYEFTPCDDVMFKAATALTVLFFALSVVLTVVPYWNYDPDVSYDAADGSLWGFSATCWTLFFTFFLCRFERFPGGSPHL